MELRYEEDETLPVPPLTSARSGSFGRLGEKFRGLGKGRHKHGDAAAADADTSAVTEGSVEWDDTQDFQDK
jgi:hypothetical protein